MYLCIYLSIYLYVYKHIMNIYIYTFEFTFSDVLIPCPLTNLRHTWHTACQSSHEASQGIPLSILATTPPPDTTPLAAAVAPWTR